MEDSYLPQNLDELSICNVHHNGELEDSEDDPFLQENAILHSKDLLQGNSRNVLEDMKTTVELA